MPPCPMVATVLFGQRTNSLRHGSRHARSVGVLLADPVSDQGAVAALVGSGAGDVRTAPERPDIQPTQTGSTPDTRWMIDISRTGAERGNIDVNPEDPATDGTIRWLFWAKRLRQLIHVAPGAALPFPSRWSWPRLSKDPWVRLRQAKSCDPSLLIRFPHAFEQIEDFGVFYIV